MEISKCILLTGAGFTHNFGGFLGEEMWTEIFNHPEIQKRQFVRELMLDDNDHDYESVYNKILWDSKYEYLSKTDKEAVRNAVYDAYLRNEKKTANGILSIYRIQEFIMRFQGDNNSHGFFFTLNQDLFIERTYLGSRKQLTLPWVKKITGLTGDGGDEDFIRLPSEDEVKSLSLISLNMEEFHYVKLHGSLNWRSCHGQNMMVIGGNKKEQIDREPLLKRYYEIFENVLSVGDRKLMVIGYGFRDEHINDTIINAIKEKGLKLYVLSPKNPHAFIKRVAPEIANGLYGYFAYNLFQTCKESADYFHNTMDERFFRI